MLLQDFFFAHAVRQPPQNVLHSNPHPSNTGFSVALVGFDRDARISRHRVSNYRARDSLKQCLCLRQNLAQDITRHIRQPEIAARVAICEAGVIKSHQVQDRRV